MNHLVWILLITFGLCILILAVKNVYTVAYNPLTLGGSSNILVKKGTKFIIYDTSADSSNNTPLIFENSTQYRKYVDTLKAQGINCPNVFIQETNDTQGNTTYTIQIDPFNPKNVDYTYRYIEGLTTEESSDVKHTSPYDRKMYMNNLATNIANSLSVNQIKSINKLELTKSVLSEDVPKCSSTPADIKPLVKNGKTADPMITNWGGVAFSQKMIDDGYYVGNEVTKPKSTQPPIYPSQ